MQPGALRALEFDRIVEAVRGFALTPMGDERLAQLAPSTDPQQVAQLLAATTETARYLAANGAVPAARVERPAADSRGARRRGARARSRCGCSRSPTFLDSIDETRAAIRRAPRIVPAARGGQRRRRVVQGRDRRRSREKIDPSGEVVDHASPELQADPRSAAQAADAAARHARVVPARQGHGEVPAGSGRHRAQRPLRARRQGRAPQRRFPASCTARRRAARACFSSRSAPSRSTTTSSRSRSRKPKKSGGFCWR